MGLRDEHQRAWNGERKVAEVAAIAYEMIYINTYMQNERPVMGIVIVYTFMTSASSWNVVMFVCMCLCCIDSVDILNMHNFLQCVTWNTSHKWA